MYGVTVGPRVPLCGFSKMDPRPSQLVTATTLTTLILSQADPYNTDLLYGLNF